MLDTSCLYLKFDGNLNNMREPQGDYSFWTKYKRFATTEILLYLIMIIGITLGIIIFG